VVASKRSSAQRLQQAIVDLQRITNSRRLHATRAQRSGVEITPVAASVLRQVVVEGPVRPVDLADRMRMRPPALSRQLRNLEADGCIERVPSPGDGRGAFVRVTPLGRKLMGRLEEGDSEILAEQLRSWSATELAEMVGLLERLIHDLRTPSPDTKRSP
jgi:DNA-binding MarR family transcriptional regulator